MAHKVVYSSVTLVEDPAREARCGVECKLDLELRVVAGGLRVDVVWTCVCGRVWTDGLVWCVSWARRFILGPFLGSALLDTLSMSLSS